MSHKAAQLLAISRGVPPALRAYVRAVDVRGLRDARVNTETVTTRVIAHMTPVQKNRVLGTLKRQGRRGETLEDALHSTENELYRFVGTETQQADYQRYELIRNSVSRGAGVWRGYNSARYTVDMQAVFAEEKPLQAFIRILLMTIRDAQERFNRDEDDRGENDMFAIGLSTPEIPLRARGSHMLSKLMKYSERGVGIQEFITEKLMRGDRVYDDQDVMWADTRKRIDVHINYVDMHAGSGYNRKHSMSIMPRVDKQRAMKSRSVVVIQNDDHLCFYRAVAVGMVRHDPDDNMFEARLEAMRKSDRPVQKKAAMKLYTMYSTRKTEPSRGVTLAEADDFGHWLRQFGYYVRVFDVCGVCLVNTGTSEAEDAGGGSDAPDFEVSPGVKETEDGAEEVMKPIDLLFWDPTAPKDKVKGKKSTTEQPAKQKRRKRRKSTKPGAAAFVELEAGCDDDEDDDAEMGDIEVDERGNVAGLIVDSEDEDSGDDRRGVLECKSAPPPASEAEAEECEDGEEIEDEESEEIEDEVEESAESEGEPAHMFHYDLLTKGGIWGCKDYCNKCDSWAKERCRCDTEAVRKRGCPMCGVSGCASQTKAPKTDGWSKKRVTYTTCDVCKVSFKTQECFRNHQERLSAFTHADSDIQEYIRAQPCSMLQAYCATCQTVRRQPLSAMVKSCDQLLAKYVQDCGCWFKSVEAAYDMFKLKLDPIAVPIRHKCGYTECKSCGEYKAYTHECTVQKYVTKYKDYEEDWWKEKKGPMGKDMPKEPPPPELWAAERRRKFRCFDFEAVEVPQADGSLHQEAILLVVKGPTGELKRYKTVDALFKDIETVTHGLVKSYYAWDDSTFIAHNGSGYDMTFIINYLTIRNLKPDYVMAGTRCLYCKVKLCKGLSIRFVDSFLIIDQPLASFPKAFGFKGAKGHAAFRKTNMANCTTPVDVEFPAMADFGISTMKDLKPMLAATVKVRSHFKEWYNAEAAKYESAAPTAWREAIPPELWEAYGVTPDEPVVDADAVGAYPLLRKITEYCDVDVEILHKSMQMLHEEMFETTGCSLFDDAWTIAKLCSCIFRSKHYDPEENGMGIIHERSLKEQASAESLEWLHYCAKKSGHRIQHAANGGEATIAGHLKVDGFCETTNTVYQYHGCYWHGCRMCYTNRLYVNKVTGFTMAAQAHTTSKQDKRIVALGYTLKKIYSCEFKRLRTVPEYRELMKADLPRLPRMHNRGVIKMPRAAMHGGRCEGFYTAVECGTGERVFYIDISSLYPAVQSCQRDYEVYPCGVPTLLTTPEEIGSLEDLTDRLFGFVQCRVLPPADIRHPVLCTTINGKYMGVCCYTCAVEEQVACDHTDPNDRALDDMFTTAELGEALARGYRLLEVYAVYHFQKTSNTLFTSYVDHFYKMKKIATVEKNPVRRLLAKKILNALWGFLAMRVDHHTRTHVLNTTRELRKLASDQSIDIVGMRRVVKAGVLKKLFVSTKLKSSEPLKRVDSSLCVGVFVTSYARLRLLEGIDAVHEVGGQLIYCDTDSMIIKVPVTEALERQYAGEHRDDWIMHHIFDRTDLPLPTWNAETECFESKLGDWELEELPRIQRVLNSGPKSYMCIPTYEGALEYAAANDLPLPYKPPEAPFNLVRGLEGLRIVDKPGTLPYEVRVRDMYTYKKLKGVRLGYKNQLDFNEQLMLSVLGNKGAEGHLDYFQIQRSNKGDGNVGLLVSHYGQKVFRRTFNKRVILNDGGSAAFDSTSVQPDRGVLELSNPFTGGTHRVCSETLPYGHEDLRVRR